MDIKKATEKQLTALLKDNAEPSEGRMKLLKLAIAYLAVNAKLEENEYGGFFAEDGSGDASGLPQRPNGEEPNSRRRKKRSNGAADSGPAAEGAGALEEGA